MRSILWSELDYLQPHWFWSGLKILIILGICFYGAVWLLSKLRDVRERRKEDGDS
jgi:hypothetical protein